jgi:hypothetical protein
MGESDACDGPQFLISHAFYCLIDQVKDRCVGNLSYTKYGFDFYRTKLEQQLKSLVSKLHTADPDSLQFCTFKVTISLNYPHNLISPVRRNLCPSPVICIKHHYFLNSIEFHWIRFKFGVPQSSFSFRPFLSSI